MDYSFFDFLRLIGSLALFLYGMKIMSEGLQKFAGDSLRRILKKNSPFKLRLSGLYIRLIFLTLGGEFTNNNWDSMSETITILGAVLVRNEDHEWRVTKICGWQFTANTNRDDHEQSNRYAHRGVNNGSYPIIIGYDGYGREFRECRTLDIDPIQLMIFIPYKNSAKEPISRRKSKKE